MADETTQRDRKPSRRDKPLDWGKTREMNAIEAMMWRGESDPRLRSTITSFAVLDCAPEWDRFVAEHPDHPITALYKDVATFVTNELASREEGVPVLAYNVGDDMVLSLPDGKELSFAPVDLRLICQCAVCVDEMTGERKIHREDLDPELYPTNIAPTGNYAAAVEWSDGTTSCIFPFDRIVETFGTP